MMMKRSLFILLLLCSCLLPATRAAAQRGLPGQVGIQVGAGVADGFLVRRSGGEYTFGAEVAVTRNNANRTFWKFAAGYLRRDYRYLRQLVPQEQYTAAISCRCCMIAATTSLWRWAPKRSSDTKP